MEKPVNSMLDIMSSMIHDRVLQITDLEGNLHLDSTVVGIKREGGTNLYIVSLDKGCDRKRIEICVKAI